MKVTKAQEKWGAMVTLLSLDVVKPFYEHMGLNIDDSDHFVEVLRKAIIANRQEFVAHPKQVPDLKKRVLESVHQQLGLEVAEKLESWYNNDFVWYPIDRRGIYDHWSSLLKQAVHHDGYWSLLDLPERLAPVAKKKLLKEVMANDQINALADQVDERPHTKWDVEMYALHNFDDYDAEPFFIGVMPVVRRYRIKQYLKWLVESLNEQELELFIRSANQLTVNKPEMQISTEIIVPEGLKLC